MATYITDFSIGAVNGTRFDTSGDLFSNTDTDVIAFTFPSGGTLHVFLDNLSAYDMDLKLFRDNGNGQLDDTIDLRLITSDRGGSNDELIQYVAPSSSSTYFALIYPFSSSFSNAQYDISIVGVLTEKTLNNSALSSGITPTSIDLARPYWSDSLIGSGSGKTDTVELSTSQSGLLGININYFDSSGNATVRVFQDSNNNGIFDVRDQLLRSETNQNYFNVQVSSGSVFVQVINDTSSSFGYEVTMGYDYLTNPVYRLLNRNNGAHLYTTSAYERDVVLGTLSNFTYEGVAMRAATAQNDALLAPVHRLLNRNNGAHLYTTSAYERDVVLRTLSNFNYEGVAYYVYPTDSQIRALSGNTLAADFELDEYENVIKETYRLYNRSNGAHLYTNSVYERDVVLQTLPNFTYEGPTFQSNAYGI